MKEKKEPSGSVVYLLHTSFQGKTFSFIGNRQTFGDLRTPMSHFEDLSFMFLPPNEDTICMDAFDIEFCMRVLKVYPGILNMSHRDQIFLNEEKRGFINQYRTFHYLNNIALNNSSDALFEFMRYNRKMKKDIVDWERKTASLYDICKLAQWLKKSNLSYINTFPRFFWFDQAYMTKVKSLGLYPCDKDVLMTLMIFKDYLIDERFVERLNRFGLYKSYSESIVLSELVEWKMGNYYKSSKKNKYADPLDYASKYMYGFCKRNGLDTEYQLEKEQQKNEINI